VDNDFPFGDQSVIGSEVVKSEDCIDGRHVEDVETQAEPRPGSLVVREEEEEEEETE
jgi:hypothetical protein